MSAFPSQEESLQLQLPQSFLSIALATEHIRQYLPYMKLFLFQVSWIRKRDLHILTAGILTYTSDQRFQVIRPDKSDNWTLQIKFPQLRDSGVYECQVNTEPKMSLPFRLNVIGKCGCSEGLPRVVRKSWWSGNFVFVGCLYA